jgi:hypothetical protein
MGNCGAIAEGYFPGIGWLSSLGRAGVNKDGTLKSNACCSQESAERRAMKTLVNKYRYRLGGEKGMVSTESRYLSDEQVSRFLGEIMAVVSWEYIGGNLSKIHIDHKVFNAAMKRVVA